LNVAITRAKKKIYIVKSIESNELHVTGKSAGPIRLKQYLEFSEYVDRNQKKEKDQLLNSIYNLDMIHSDELGAFDSPFEEEVYREIVKIVPNTILIRNQVDVSGYLIDLALFSTKSNKFILGVECDGYQWHSKPEDKERDFYRQQYLESRGWRIHRILSTNWWNDKQKEVDKVKLIIDTYLAAMTDNTKEE